ncbi:MAG TPA: 3-deoxy-8-phosphooctulonate synthase [Planctomycetota bacterium]|nr:3-deoxy-8-phosphooctulonate synthase [Planctomycetota bacterium]
MRIGDITIERGGPLFLLAGPCVIEDDRMPFAIARELRDLCASLGVPFVFKASFDKANRTSGGSFRGPGPKEGLAILAEVARQVGVPVLTDIHEPAHAELCAGKVDVVQIPAMLSRQTDLLVAAGRSGCAVNIKKGQGMAPWDIGWCIDKVTATGNERVLVTERGVSFGYNTLVNDMRAMPEMAKFGKPVVFDATHSAQRPSAGGGKSSGDRELAKVLARAAVGAGCDGLFAETHPDPDRALSDGPNMIRLADMRALLTTLVAVRAAVAADVARERAAAAAPR